MGNGWRVLRTLGGGAQTGSAWVGEALVHSALGMRGGLVAAAAWLDKGVHTVHSHVARRFHKPPLGQAILKSWVPDLQPPGRSSLIPSAGGWSAVALQDAAPPSATRSR